MTEELNPFPDKQSELEWLEWQQEQLGKQIIEFDTSTPGNDPAPQPQVTPGRYGLTQSLMHPGALLNPAAGIFTRPDALSHSTSLTGLTDRELTQPTPQQEDSMAKIGDRHAQNLREAPAQIAAKIGQELNAARETIAQAFDLRLASAQTYMRDVPGVERVDGPPPAPLSPLAQAIKSAEISVAQGVQANKEREPDMER